MPSISPRPTVQTRLERVAISGQKPLPGTPEGLVSSHGHISGLAEVDEILLSKIWVALNLQRESQLTKEHLDHWTAGKEDLHQCLGSITDELRDPSPVPMPMK